MSDSKECNRCGTRIRGDVGDHECAALLVLHDGCDGDKNGLAAALGAGFVVLYEYISNEGWGHHSYDQLFRTADGRIVHAECGGCSCEGSGSWSECASVEEAMRLVPEWRRPEVTP